MFEIYGEERSCLDFQEPAFRQLHCSRNLAQSEYKTDHFEVAKIRLLGSEHDTIEQNKGSHLLQSESESWIEMK